MNFSIQRTDSMKQRHKRTNKTPNPCNSRKSYKITMVSVKFTSVIADLQIKISLLCATSMLFNG